MAKRLIVADYDAIRKAFDEEFKETQKLIESGETHLDNLAEGFTEADRVLRKMPTVDAVEVTRCKDCKHYEVRNTGYSYCYLKKGETDESPVKVYADDYCSYGERKYSAEEQQGYFIKGDEINKYEGNQGAYYIRLTGKDIARMLKGEVLYIPSYGNKDGNEYPVFIGVVNATKEKEVAQ